jgi:hypothetical protein
MDCRIEKVGDHERIEFSFVGHDERDEVVGRGWALNETGRNPHQYLYGQGSACMSVHQGGGHGEACGREDRHQGHIWNPRLPLEAIREDPEEMFTKRSHFL